MTWHPDDPLLHAYTAATLDDTARWSVEQHLTNCTACRERIVQADVPSLDLDDRLDAIWDEVVYEIDARERRTPVERLLLAMGVPDHLARLLSATPSLTLSWLLAVAGTLAIAVAVARVTYEPSAAASSTPLLFLVIAPLLPLAGVAVSFGPGVDPTYDLELAAPLQAGRLLLTRSVAVLGTTIPLAGLAALALPELDWTVVAWVLPAFALATVSLAMSSRLAPVTACSLVAGLWVVGVAVVESAAPTPLVAFGPAAQAGMLLATAVAGVLVAGRMDRFELKSGS